MAVHIKFTATRDHSESMKRFWMYLKLIMAGLLILCTVVMFVVFLVQFSKGCGSVLESQTSPQQVQQATNTSQYITKSKNLSDYERKQEQLIENESLLCAPVGISLKTASLLGNKLAPFEKVSPPTVTVYRCLGEVGTCSESDFHICTKSAETFNKYILTVTSSMKRFFGSRKEYVMLENHTLCACADYRISSAHELQPTLNN